MNQDKFLEYNSIAGDYLTVNGFFNELDRTVNHSGYTGTAAGENYAYSFFFNDSSSYFADVCTLQCGWACIKNYNPETNTANSKLSENFWQDKGVDITYYYGDEKDEENSTNGSSNIGSFINSFFNKKNSEKTTETNNSNSTDKSSTNKSSSSKFIDNKTTSTVDRSKNCHICNGSGRKACTSCNGGYYTEYETGTYMGYGSPTRAVKKRCMVCRGTGYVKCYH